MALITTPTFRDGLSAAVPSLRAFALSLTRNADVADDLVQETLVRAWTNQDKYTPGTTLNAWLFTILRNLFYSQHRRAWREVEDPEGSYAVRLKTAPDQHARLDFQDLQAALAQLPVDQREALILVAAEGLSYEEAAQVCGVALGTIKSRVNRGRHRLAHLLAVETVEDLGPDRGTQAALQEAL